MKSFSKKICLSKRVKEKKFDKIINSNLKTLKNHILTSQYKKILIFYIF